MELEEFRAKYNYCKASAVMQQYLDIKFNNIDCLIFFRMGDFYELFYEDAVTASRVLNITLTKRGKTDNEEILMCGVPHHAMENYLNKLLEEGFKVAVCDQLETPEDAKKRGGYKAVMQRNVVRIITAGTITEESLLSDNKPNYLASVTIGKNEGKNGGEASICYVDLSTAEISVITVPQGQLINELARLSPKEILLSDKYKASPIAADIYNQLALIISFHVDSFFASKKCERIILEFYQIQSLAAISSLKHEEIGAIGSIIEYLSLTQKANLPKLPKPKIINYHQFMNIDAATRRNLELVSSKDGSSNSIFSSLDDTISKGGRRLLYDFLAAPLINDAEINNRLDITEYFAKNYAIVQVIRKELKKTGDIKRSLTRINMRRSIASDLLNIKNTIKIAEEIRAVFLTMPGNTVPNYIDLLIRPLVGNDIVWELIEESIREDAATNFNEGGIIKLNYHPKIKELHDSVNNMRSRVEQLQNQYRTETKIDSLKITHNNVIGLFIDITARHSSKIFASKFIHRQTTANSVRYTTPELQELEEKMVNARTLMISLEQEIYAEICRQVMDNHSSLAKLADSLSAIDVFCSFAYQAAEYNYCRPILVNDMSFNIEEGRHLTVERALKANNNSFVPNNCLLSRDERIWLITGPNMAGKSTFLRQNAIIAILAHIGSFVPAKTAKIGIVDKIFSRIGAGDNIAGGQSTFMVEMLETSAIIAQSTHKSLVILDEVGRGTSTYDGVAIAWSVLEHIHDKLRCRCLFATHYYELTDTAKILPALQNYTVAIDDSTDKILFLHTICQGIATRSYGVHVAELAGLPQSVIRRARELLNKLEQNSSKSNKKIIQNESCNLNLFTDIMGSEQNINNPQLNNSKLNNPEVNSPYQQLIQTIKNTDLDTLTPRQAHDLIYHLKGLL